MMYKSLRTLFSQSCLNTLNMKTTIILGLSLLCYRLLSGSPLPRPQSGLGVAPLQARPTWFQLLGLQLDQSDQIVTCELGDILHDKRCRKETVVMVGGGRQLGDGPDEERRDGCKDPLAQAPRQPGGRAAFAWDAP